jgi:hypothetical protein
VGAEIEAGDKLMQDAQFVEIAGDGDGGGEGEGGGGKNGTT